MRKCPQCHDLGIPLWALPMPLGRTRCRHCGALVSATWASTAVPVLLMFAGFVAFGVVGAPGWRFVLGPGLFLGGLWLFQARARLVVK